MSEVKNLLDMFLNGRKDVQAKGAKANAPKAREADAKGSLLPIEPTAKSGTQAKAKSASGPSLSFQARVKESRAKLEAKTGQASQPARGAQADKAAGSKPARAAHRNEDVSHADTDRPARASRPGKTDRSETSRAHSRKAALREGAAAADRMDNADVTSPAISVRDAAPAGDEADAAPQAIDAKAMEALKEGLKEIGIDADDEQLLDPEFLEGILQMLQALPLQAGTDDQSDSEATADITNIAVTDATEPPVAQAAAVPADAVLSAMPAQADAQAAVNAKTAVPENAQPETADVKAGSEEADSQAAVTVPADMLPATDPEVPAISRKELADLLSKQIEALKGQDTGTTHEAAAPASAIAATPTPSRGFKLREQGGITVESHPLSELDRLRITQSASFQAGQAGTRIEAASVEEDSGELPAMESAGESAHGIASPERDSGSAGNDGLSDGSGDLSGKNGEGFRGADASGRNDGATASKDAAGIPHFQSNLEQARSVEHRTGVERAWEPRPAFDGSALEQIAKKMSAAGHKAGDGIDIQLSPEHLGKVRVSLEMKDGGMSARIAVENDDVRKQVEDGLASLKDALANQGIKLEGLEVSVDQRQSSLFNPDGSNAESFFHRQHKGGRGGNEAAQETAPFESAPESDTGRRWGYNTMEYIG